MVFKLPSARCLSKASRDGALSENMANADINASLKGNYTSSTRSYTMVAKCSRSKRKSASAQRYLRPFGTTMDIATLNLTSSTCDIVPMRAVLWHSCLRKARGDTGMVTGIYRPPGIAGQYATVHKTRHKGRVVHVEPRIVFGEEDAIKAALEASPVSTTINTAFVEVRPVERK